MTNVEIIEKYKKLNNIPENTALLTFMEWKKRGYNVKKGEHAKYKISVWKCDKKKRTDEDGKEYETEQLFMTIGNFFTIDQVERK